MDLFKILDIPPEPRTSSAVRVLNLMTLDHKKLHTGLSESLGVNHPENMLWSPFAGGYRKSLWYHRDLVRPDSVQNHDYLARITIISDTIPTWSMTLNGSVLETHDTAVMKKTGPRRWDITSFFHEHGFPLKILGSLDVLKLESTGDIWCHVATCDPDVETDTPDTHRWTVDTEVSHENETFIPNGAVTSMRWNTDQPTTQIDLDSEMIWNLVTDVICTNDSTECVWDTCIDSGVISDNDRILGPGLPMGKSITIHGGANIVAYERKIIEIRGRGTDVETVGVIVK